LLGFGNLVAKVLPPEQSHVCWLVDNEKQQPRLRPASALDAAATALVGRVGVGVCPCAGAQIQHFH
jgi:hypothetical protein